MNEGWDKLNNLFHVTFAVFTFWIVSVGFFLATVTSEGNERILLQYSPIILLYVIAYLFHINQKDNKKPNEWNIRISKILLQINLVLLGATILMLSNMQFIGGLNDYLKIPLTKVYFIMLIFIAFIVPLILIIFPLFVFLSKKSN